MRLILTFVPIRSHSITDLFVAVQFVKTIVLNKRLKDRERDVTIIRCYQSIKDFSITTNLNHTMTKAIIIPFRFSSEKKLKLDASHITSTFGCISVEIVKVKCEITDTKLLNSIAFDILVTLLDMLKRSLSCDQSGHNAEPQHFDAIKRSSA